MTRRFFQEEGRKASAGEQWSLGMPDSATTTTMAMTYIDVHTLNGKSLYTGSLERHDVSITTDLSQHAHRIRFASRNRDRLIDRPIADTDCLFEGRGPRGVEKMENARPARAESTE